jgi:hypothetical protein
MDVSKGERTAGCALFYDPAQSKQVIIKGEKRNCDVYHDFQKFRMKDI